MANLRNDHDRKSHYHENENRDVRFFFLGYVSKNTKFDVSRDKGHVKPDTRIHSLINY